MLNLLAFDTSTEACSVALVLGSQVTDYFEIAPRQQAARILVIIEKLLREADVKLKQLDAIAFASGPGSFTGIRLAASIAQGLALGAGLPIIPISTLCVMAQSAHHTYQATDVLVAMDAHSGDVYWGVYQWDGVQAMTPVVSDLRCDPAVVFFPEGPLYTGIGNGWEKYSEVLYKRAPKVKDIQVSCYPHAADIAKLAAIALSQGLILTPDKVIPHYLHQADTWKKSAELK